MGESSRSNRQRCPPGCDCGRHRSNAGSFDQHTGNLDAGRATRFERKHPEPSLGDRFGELEVVGFERGAAGGLLRVRVRCTCGGEHFVLEANLRKGKTARCNDCAKRKATDTRKHYWGYEDVCPDPDHRRRLLNRIAACLNRCRNPNDAAYPNYGGRGIRVHPPWVSDRKEYLRHLLTLDGWDNPTLELDRRDCNGHYEPGNLRFVTRSDNRKNQRKVQDLQRSVHALEAQVRDLEACLRLEERRSTALLFGEVA